ncbi:MAG: elongation factor G-like protein EF-G2 [Nocardioidaceae bacterium]
MAGKTTRTDGVIAADRADAIRNVAVVGPAGSGKTTLVETLLVSANVLSRAGSVTEGTTVSDHDEAEHRQQRSVGLAIAPLHYQGVKINLIDTPGYADYVGELRAGLRAADCAVFVIAADDGIDGATRQIWRECAAVGMPRAVVVSKVDHPRADYDAVVSEAVDALGDKVVPVYLREGGALVGLLTGDHEHEEQRGALIEAVIEESEDETLMERYLGGEEVDAKLLVDDLETAVARASFFPLMPMDSSTGLGATELLDLMVSCFPSPLEHPSPAVFTPAGVEAAVIGCEADGPLVAEVVKTTSDPYVGRVSIVRVFSGTLRPDATVHVSGHFSAFFPELQGHADHDEDERIGALSEPLGKTLRPTSQAIAGDICAIGKLTRAETGDTLSDKDNPRVLKPWTLPEPLLPIAIEARAKADEDKLGAALARLAAEDPTLRIEHNAETHQIVLWCLGEAHADVLLDRLENRYAVGVDQVEVKVPLRETFAVPASGHGRHVKQSGGHGQYAVCDITVEPLPQGAGFEFVDKVVGGAVPRQFIGSVEKGVIAQMSKGCAGHPMVDIRVTLTDGKAHSVDSSDMAFQTAGALALREAAAAARVSVLEPVAELEIVVPDDLVGTVMSDLSGRRGRVLGSEPAGDEHTAIRAEVPEVEIGRYAIDLRAFSHGTASFTRKFARYEPMPDNVAAKLV